MRDTNFLSEIPEVCLQFAFYFHRRGAFPIFEANAEQFSSASLIKVPILLACAFLERTGAFNLDEIWDLNAETQVHGAGFAHRMHARRLPFHDVLLMMIANSDNLCTNLVIHRIGIERLNAIFHQELGLTADTELQRKLMDFEARARGLDNWIAVHDCLRLFELVEALPQFQRAWLDPMLQHCQDSSFLMRDLARDSIHFSHKTGSIPGVMHDWGYTPDCQIFLLTNGVTDESRTNHLFGQAGRLLVGKSPTTNPG